MRSDTYISNAVPATFNKQRHSVSRIYFPRLCNNIKQPPFRYKTIKNRKHDFLFILLGSQRHGRAQRTWILKSQIMVIIPEVESIIILCQETAEDTIDKYISFLHTSRLSS